MSYNTFEEWQKIRAERVGKKGSIRNQRKDAIRELIAGGAKRPSVILRELEGQGFLISRKTLWLDLREIAPHLIRKPRGKPRGREELSLPKIGRPDTPSIPWGA